MAAELSEKSESCIIKAKSQPVETQGWLNLFFNIFAPTGTDLEREL